MKHKQASFWKKPLTVAMTAMALVVAGCDPNDPEATGTTTPPAATTVVSGIAAIGDPIVGGVVTLNCNGTGTIPAISPTGANGGWTVTLPSSVLPCAVRVSGGNIGTAGGTVNATDLYSLITSTAAAVVANVTTMTTLALARAVQTDPATAQALTAWFAASNQHWADIADSIAAAQAQMIAALQAAGYTVPAGFNPYTTAFSAVPGNGYDDLMEQVRAAIAAASSNYAAYLQAFAMAAGNTPSLPTYTPPEDPEEPEEPEEPETPGENPLGTKNGIAFTIGSHTWKLGDTYTERFGVPNNHRQVVAKNAINQARTDYVDTNEIKTGLGKITRAEVTVQRTASPGLQNCAAGGVAIQIESLIPGVFTQEGREWNTTACQIDLDYVSDRGGVGGTIVSATLSNTHTIGNDPTPITTTVTISGGQFRVYQHRGETGTAPTVVPDDAYNVMSITEGSFEFPEGQYFVMKNNAGLGYGVTVADGTEPWGTGNASDNITWGFGNDFFGAAGANNTNNCGTIYTAGSRFQMTLRLGPYQGEMDYWASVVNGEGTCQVVLDQTAGGLRRGHYTATLITRDNQFNGLDYINNLDARKISIAGIFKNFLLVPVRAANEGNEGALGSATRKSTVVIDDGNAHFVAGDSFLLTNTSQELQPGTTAYRMDFRREFDHFNTTNVERIQRGVQLQFLQVPRPAGGQTGTFPCSANTSGTTISLRTDQNVGYSTGTAGASCSITVTSYTSTTVEGTYTATLVAAGAAPMLPSNDNTITIHGSFRENIAAAP